MPLFFSSVRPEKAKAFYPFPILSQNILERKVGEDAGALAQHTDELLRRVLHVGILQDVDAAIHLVVGSINRNSSHAFLQDGGGFRKYSYQIAAIQEVEDDVHIIHFYHDLGVEILALYQVIEGVAGLQPLAWKDEVVALQL